MRPIWKGHISFGLVSVPVRLYSAEQKADLRFHMIDSRNFSRVRYERVNAETGEEVPWGEIVKGYEYDDGNYVVLGEEDLKRASPEATKSVEIQGFVDLAEIDMVYFDRPYFLEPTEAGRKGYALLRETLAQTGRAGIAKVVIHSRQYLAAMAPRGDALVLCLLRYAQEVRSAEDLDLPGAAEEEGVSAAEIKMARTLVESMADEWNPSQYTDEYRSALMEWIEEKIASGDVRRVAEPAQEEEEEAPAPINLMEALKKSVAKSSGGAKKTPSRSSKTGKTAKKTSRKKAG